MVLSQETAAAKSSYGDWLRSVDPSIHTIDLSRLSSEDAARALLAADGIVFTGGDDIHPDRYRRPDAVNVCTPDQERDEREFAWFSTAQSLRLPVLGICRGMQLINVALGGTLHPHLPHVSTRLLAHQGIDGHDLQHPLRITHGSFLARVTGGEEALINSAHHAHHQSIDRIAEGLACVAFSPDGIVEAIEAARFDLGFCLGVQWHPERLPSSHPVSRAVGSAFLRQIGAMRR